MEHEHEEETWSMRTLKSSYTCHVHRTLCKFGACSCDFDA